MSGISKKKKKEKAERKNERKKERKKEKSKKAQRSYIKFLKDVKTHWQNNRKIPKISPSQEIINC